VINTGIVLGLFVTTAFDLALPDIQDDSASNVQAIQDDYLWRISYSLQLINVALTTLVWLFIFKEEPVKFLIQQAEKRDRVGWAYRSALTVIKKNYNCDNTQRVDEVYLNLVS